MRNPKKPESVKIRILYTACLALLLGACFKDVSYETTYVLQPTSQAASDDVVQPFEGALAYAYKADTTEWTVATYADALAGIVSMKEDPSQRLSLPYAQAAPYEKEGTTGWLSMSLSQASQMVIVVDPVNRLYAYTQQKLAQNLPATYVAVQFKLWKAGNSYKDGNWSFYNEFYKPPVALDCLIDPRVQRVENGSVDSIAQVKAYAYAADTTLWYTASYEDAANGVIRSKNDSLLQRTNPTLTAYKDPGTGLYKMRISDEPLMIVVVDQTDRLFAYTQFTADPAADSVVLPLTFRPWLATWRAKEGDWCFVDQAYDPDSKTETVQTTLSRR